MSKAKVVQTQILYGKPQELTNIITHAIGAAFGFVGLIFLMLETLRLGTAPLGVFSISIYGATLVLTPAMSALHHGMRHGTRARDILGGIDRSTAALLVFGAFAPLLLIGMPRGTDADGVWGYTLFAIAAAATIAATVLNSIDAQKFKAIALVLYILLGAACVVRIDRVWQLCGSGCFWFMLGGAAVYALGLLLYMLKKLPFNHALWHITVLIGAALHFVGIYFYLL